MATPTNLGFPRMGPNRELKKLVENFWSGKLEENALLDGAKDLRASHWQLQSQAGLVHIPSNDFSLYDHVLDHSMLFGVIPDRYRSLTGEGLTRYFAMARGLQDRDSGVDVQASEMKKWFDTNYHYMVPEFERDQRFELASSPKPLVEFKEALELNLKTRPVLVGPLTYLWLGKKAAGSTGSWNIVDLLPNLVVEYAKLVRLLVDAGASWIQFDEPILSFDLVVERYETLYMQVYSAMREAAGKSCKLLLTNYFGRLGDNLNIVTQLPIDALHIDLVRAPAELDQVLSSLPSTMSLSMGLINGRNVWGTNYAANLDMIAKAVDVLGIERVLVAPSCSMLHSPFTIKNEERMDNELKSWMSFAVEKMEEIVVLSQATKLGPDAVNEVLEHNANACDSRRTSRLIHDDSVQQSYNSITHEMFHRSTPFAERYAKQIERLHLPLFPTTTIGSFPQTKEVRVARQKYKKGEMSQEKYDAFIKQTICDCVELQESIGLDVLVHGEAERNDMVEFFGENMRGYVFSQNGWVQSYGSRCVKPPIIFGDVSRPQAMTIETTLYAQKQTTKPMKGMLTGPITMLQWSFVRDDQPRRQTAFQLALAIRREVQDLESGGIAVIQIDEPAIREGLPLRRDEWSEYLKWAVESFRLCSSGVRDETQIHSHFCYSDFNDIFEAIEALDADVITIENARSDLKLLEAFHAHGYMNAIGPGVYDIHSPRVPTAQEMADRLQKLKKYISKDLLWINPDCGLKTRGQKEVKESLTNMVSVAKSLRLQE